MNVYTFETENGKRYMTSAKSNVTIAGIEYEATTLHRTEYSLDPIVTKSNLTIFLPGDNEFARSFLTETTLSLTVVIGTMRGTPFFRGRLVTVEYTSDFNISLLFEPKVVLGNKTTGERRIFQRNCPYEVYNKRTCRAPEVRTRVRVIDVPSSRALKVRYDTGDPGNGNRGDLRFNVIPIRGELTNSKANIGFLIGGIAVPTSSSIVFEGRLFERRMWITNITDRVAMGSLVEFEMILFREHSVLVNETVDVMVGCKRTTASCRDIHNNIENFGGFPGMTKASPFAGGLRS